MNYLFNTRRFKVREAEEKDIAYVMEMERKEENRFFVFQNTYNEHLNGVNSPDMYLMIIEEQDTLSKAGFILCVLDRRSDAFELRRVVIDSKNKGSGREVIEELMDYVFKNLPVNKLWLDVFSDNVRAVHLYESMGMVYEGTKRQGYKDDNGVYRDQMLFGVLKSEYNVKSMRK